MQSPDTLLDVLGIHGPPGNHMICPFHSDRNGSFSVFHNGREWRWRCHAGCGSGGMKEACERTGKEAGDDIVIHSYMGDVLKWPVPDLDLLCTLIPCSRSDATYTSFEEKRKISKHIVDCFHLGITTHWGREYFTIPIEDVKGNKVAVKMHAVEHQGGLPKCTWATTGTVPKEKPKHGVSTLFPRPEIWNKLLKLYICPGELKALRLITLGRQAVSPTGGESFAWPEDELDRLRGFRCTVVYDDDEAGIRFKDKTVRALRGAGIPCKAITCGRKP